jgi:hypothetical protein
VRRETGDIETKGQDTGASERASEREREREGGGERDRDREKSSL